MITEHKELILTHIQELKQLLQAQSETLLKQSKLIEDQNQLLVKQDEGLKSMGKALIYAAETTRLQSHKIQELMVDHQLVSLIKPVNEWAN